MAHYTDATVTLHHGDCLDILKTLPDASVDSVVCDPPYGLEFMGKDWDSPWKRGDDINADAGMSATGYTDGGERLPRPSFTGSTNPKCLHCKGTRRGRRDGTAKVAVCLCDDGGRFPNVRAVEMRAFQDWCELWAAECLRVLKPGGHILAFGGTRTFHRLACAVEDAGFEIRDSIAWLYGSGFPKSLDVSKAIDRRPGIRSHADFAAHLKERREAAGLSRADVSEAVVGTRSGACWNWEHHQFPEAKWWLPLRDLLVLNDAWGAVVAEAERAKIGERTTGIGTGKGSVAIMGDGNRDVTASATDDARTWQGWGTALKPAFEPVVVARKPLAGTVAANVLAHGTGALNVDGCRLGGGQDYRDKCASVVGLDSNRNGDAYGEWAGTRQDSAHASGRWPANVILDESQAAELDEQSGESVSNVRPPTGKDDRGIANTESQMVMRRNDNTERGVADRGGASRFFYIPRSDDPCVTSTEPAPTTTETGASGASNAPDTTGNDAPSVAASGDLTSRFLYTAKADQSERVRVDGVAHPTVKPLALMRWLVRLVTPPGGTVLEPFAGSGTTVEACILEGFKCVAIEREADYLPLIVQRIHRRRDPVEAVRGSGEDGGLFDLLGEDIA